MVLFIVFAMISLVLYCIFWFWSGPKLYKGDRIEVRACKSCQGNAPECPYCSGDNKIKVLVPGPNRPTIIYGDVYEQEIRFPNIKGVQYEWKPIPGRVTFSDAAPGEIKGARVVFIKQSGETTEITTSPTGRFNITLSPGKYNVTVTKDGYKGKQEILEVPFLTAPIILEEQSTLTLYDSIANEIYGTDAMSLGIGMVK
jgi:hypothetical protein